MQHRLITLCPARRTAAWSLHREKNKQSVGPFYQNSFFSLISSEKMMELEIFG